MWSFQYIFLRVAVPGFGAAAVSEGRALFASLFLVPWVVWVARQRVGPLEHWRDHLAVALVNNVLPFVCFAWAAGVLPASYLAVINGMVPLWAAVIAVPVFKERLSASRVAGFAFGIAGVALIVNLGPVEIGWSTVLGTLVAIAGAGFWGWAGVMIKQRAGRLPPMGLAAGSIAFAAVLMARSGRRLRRPRRGPRPPCSRSSASASCAAGSPICRSLRWCATSGRRARSPSGSRCRCSACCGAGCYLTKR
jgi:drug/metabolite transporter (DMT)-like permease